MEEQNNHLSMPSNYVSIIKLKQRWLEEKEQRQRALDKPKERNRDQGQEIQPQQKGEMPEDMKVKENLNIHALEINSQVRNYPQRWQLKHNRFASLKNQGTTEAIRGKEEQSVVEVKLDDPLCKGFKNVDNDLELAVKGKRKGRFKKKKKKKKKKQTTLIDEKNPKSEGEPIQDQNCEVAMKRREHLPEFNGKKLRTRGRNTDEKKGIEDEYGPNSSNVDPIPEIGGKFRHFSINNEFKTEGNRIMNHNNGIRRGYGDSRVNVRLNRHEMEKEKREALVWVRKGEICSGVSHDFHSRVARGSIDGPSGEPKRLNK